MMHNQHKQQEYRRSMNAEREDLQQAAQCFLRSMFRTGISFALLPVKRLPHKSQQHFHTAGREFTQGVATLVHELANGIEGLAKGASTTPTFEDGPHSDGEQD